MRLRRPASSRRSGTPRTAAEVLRHPEAAYDLVRPGVALFGIAPGPDVRADLRPALTWRSAVSFARRLPAGERLSYGHRYELTRDAMVATVPVGYADGYPRALSSKADVLIRGARCRVAGNVTMDQVLVDCGDLEVHAGDEVVLLGAQGGEEVTAWELAAPRRHDRLRDRDADRPACSPRLPGRGRMRTLAEAGAEAATCTRCGLAGGRTQVVYGVGDPDADLLFIGEAPGMHEDKQGIPFVGAAGQLLTRMLEGIGLTRDEVYIANVIKCRPPGNRDPQPDEIEACTPG